MLDVEDLRVAVEGKQIVNGLSLTVPAGEVHAIMGPNGSGKSTLANALMGHPRYEVTGGQRAPQGRGHHRACRRTSARRGACSWRSSTRRRSPA